jgi:hypothetical protein
MEIVTMINVFDYAKFPKFISHEIFTQAQCNPHTNACQKHLFEHLILTYILCTHFALL